MLSAADPGRSPTFVVGSERQRGTLDSLVKRQQHFAEQYQNNKPLCFNAKTYQKTHPQKAMKGRKDADATLCSPMLLAVADGVSQIEEFGIDASELPNELLNAIEEAAVNQLLPGQETEEYCGPIKLMKDAYESTECLGSTTVLTAIMDNSTRIHGKLHPMIAVCSIGDCEIVILRRSEGRYLSVFHTEMQRIDGNAQAPLQLARVDDTVDPDFDPSIPLEVIERGSAVHCVSAFEGDIVVLGSDGIFDNLFISEIVSLCEEMIPAPASGLFQEPVDRKILGQIAVRLVAESHAKTQPGPHGWAPAPIGAGGKIDDTSCVVAEVVEWTEEHGEAWADIRSQRRWTDWTQQMHFCRDLLPPGCRDEFVMTDEVENGDGSQAALVHQQADGSHSHQRNYPAKPNADSFSTYWGGSFHSGDAFLGGYTGDERGRPMHQETGPRLTYKEPEEPEHNEGCSVM